MSKVVNTVCLCGSTKYMDAFNEANVELTKRGFSVITISMALPKKSGQLKPEDEGLKNYLDLVHLNKVLRSDAVFVVGPGYIGYSTAREILWTDMQGKRVLLQWMCKNTEGAIDWNAAAVALRSGVTCHTAMAVGAARAIIGLL